MIVTFVYFAHITSFYFMLKWVPKIVVDLGFDAKSAAGVLTWANVGGAIGGALFGLIATRVSLKTPDDLHLPRRVADGRLVRPRGHGS